MVNQFTLSTSHHTVSLTPSSLTKPVGYGPQNSIRTPSSQPMSIGDQRPGQLLLDVECSLALGLVRELSWLRLSPCTPPSLADWLHPFEPSLSINYSIFK
jgi:hypothetical protein